MQITFNLEAAQIYIPSGRLMNLKHRLNWDEIELNITDENQIKNYIRNSNFTVNTDFNMRLQSKVKSFMQQYSYDHKRLDMYKSLTYKSLDYDSFFDKHLPQVELLEKLIEDIGFSLQENNEILSKKKKLAQLQLVNSMN